MPEPYMRRRIVRRPPMTAYGHPLHPALVVPHRIQPAAGGYHVVAADGSKTFVSTHGQKPSPAAALGAAPGEAPMPQGVQDPASPLDSTYFAQAAQNTFRLNQGLASSDLQGQQRQAALQEALRRLSSQQPRDEQTVTEAANRQGLFYSGALGQRLGDLATRYAQRRADANTSFANQEAARLAARAALQQGYGVDDAALQAAAVERQIGRDASAADVGGLVGPGQPAYTAPARGGGVSGMTAFERPMHPAVAGTHVTYTRPAEISGGSVVHSAPPQRVARRRTAFGRSMYRG